MEGKILGEDRGATAPGKVDASESTKTHRKKPELENLGRDMVTIIVRGKEYFVHEELITYHSPYLATAFSCCFEAAAKKILTLENTSIEAFDLFIRWIYRGDLRGSSWSSSTNGYGLYGVCLLAKKLLMPKLHNCAVDEILFAATLHRFDHFEAVQAVYENTGADSAIRRLMIDLVALCPKQQSLTQRYDSSSLDVSKIAPQFLFDVILRMRRNSGSMKVNKLTGADYKIDSYLADVGK